MTALTYMIMTALTYMIMTALTYKIMIALTYKNHPLLNYYPQINEIDLSLMKYDLILGVNLKI
jgi:hypothetical protein